MPDPRTTSKQQAAKEVLDVLNEISTILNTGLDRNSLSICVSLIENGVNPDALAAVVRELRQEGRELGIEPGQHQQ
ncbi:hypothetical protein EX30DRAFT_392049 [Ascodesmis nigricans]|uniref:Mitotic-spindle organizing protein 1 n=1 Tax=Ascodesmis nigricans TaxID=341454 RepID=A0A4S2N5Q1_9PEZI|nr:hypothetical protein EX30DRAFT_392049 [Ascodesmis nigricans]